MNQPVISVEHLTKRYNLGVINTGTLSRDLNKWWARMRGKPDPYAKIGQADHGNRQGDSILALDDVSFTVEQGEVLGIIGKNGAGKSTLLKILSQVTAPTSGVVRVMGRIGSLLEVGTGFHPELTGRENVFLNGAILGMRKDEVERKFDEIVDFSGVEMFIDTPVKRYSSGMYVRLAFAVAAHLDPEILVVDEVLAVGDVEFQKKCLGKMGDVASEGRTVLFVSHNMAAVQNLCNNGFLLDNGCISFQGEIGEVVNAYLSGMFHTSSENDFHGHVSFSENKSKPAQIRQITLKDSTGQNRSIFEYNESPVIELLVNIRKPSKDYAIVLVLRDLSAHPVLHSSDTDFSEQTIADASPGNYYYNISLPPSLLKPGNYNLTLRLKEQAHRGTRHDFDVHNSVLTFEVLEAITDKGTRIDKGREAVIVPKIDWKLDRQNTSI